jgi:hypothetical protein
VVECRATPKGTRVSEHQWAGYQDTGVSGTASAILGSGAVGAAFLRRLLKHSTLRQAGTAGHDGGPDHATDCRKTIRGTQPTDVERD